MIMNRKRKLKAIGMCFALALFVTACVTEPPSNSNSETRLATQTPSSSPATTPVTQVAAVPITLPVLDAFFSSDEKFPGELKTKLSLTDEQIAQLQAVARQETSKLRETETGDHSGTTAEARELAANRVKEIIGA
jgi:PBP1b-binding outer membrane lipoprotein LpoB